MSKYTIPGVYIEDTPNPPMITSSNPSVGAFVGVSQRGTTDKPVLVSSWSSYIKNFAYGMESPFLADSDLAYAVYGFFQNGGSKCYISRAVANTATQASIKVPSVDPTLIINAKDKGDWGNDLAITVKRKGQDFPDFNLEVLYKGERVEYYTDITNDTTDTDRYWVNVIRNSSFIEYVSGELSPIESEGFVGGISANSTLEDADFIKAMNLLDTVDDFSMLAIPGQGSQAMTSAIIDYANKREDVFVMLESEGATDTGEHVAGTFTPIVCDHGAVYHPWLKVYDPLSAKNNNVRMVPPTGHVMGVYSRIINERGVGKAPAGTEATVRGTISTTYALTPDEVDSMTQAGAVPIVAKTNYGVVLWGARGLSKKSYLKYVSDVLLDMHIKKTVYNSTQTFVFEPNDPNTWLKLTTLIETFLNSLWTNGELLGDTAEQAYFVKCDEELNTPDSIAQGKLICEIGYASKKPAEFVIFRFSHDMASQ